MLAWVLDLKVPKFKICPTFHKFCIAKSGYFVFLPYDKAENKFGELTRELKWTLIICHGLRLAPRKPSSQQRDQSEKNLLAFLGEVFAFIGAVEKFSIEKLNSDDGENELKN